jgi:hypothetical protein
MPASRTLTRRTALSRTALKIKPPPVQSTSRICTSVSVGPGPLPAALMPPLVNARFIIEMDSPARLISPPRSTKLDIVI